MREQRDRVRPIPTLAPAPAAVALGALACAGAVAWLVAAHLGAPRSQRLVDLDVYRDAGRAVLHGGHLYSLRAHPPQRLPFTYPPFAALLAVPLAWLPFMVAGWIWTVGEVVTTVAITWLAGRALWPRAGRWWPLALGLVAGAMQQMLPLRDEIKFGQVDELLVLLCAVDCLLLLRTRGGGALIGLATAIKLTPAVFVVYLLLSGRRRAAFTAAAVFAVTTAGSATALPHDSKVFWTDALWHSERLRANDGTANQSLRGMWLRAVHDGRLSTALWVASVVVVAAIGYRRATAAARGGDELLGVALTGLLAVLLSPVAWIHHLCWLPLVLGALLGAAPTVRRTVVVAALYLFFVVKVPWIGSHLLHDGVPTVLARVVQDGFGLMALVLLVTASSPSATSVARRRRLRHTEALIKGA